MPRRSALEMSKKSGEFSGDEASLRKNADLAKVNQRLEQDLSRCRQTEEALRSTEDKLTKSFMAFPDPAILFALDGGRLLMANNAFFRAMGKEPEDLLGKGLADIALWKNNEERKHALDGLKREKKVKNLEFTAPFRGEDRAFLFSGEVIHLHGEPHVVATIKEVAEVRRAVNTLADKEVELEVKVRQLQEVNEALRQILAQNKEDGKKFEQRIVANVEDLVLPYVRRLKGTSLDVDQKVYVNVIESNLSELVAPFMRQIGNKHANLTPREIEVANMVRMGASSKEISKLLDISKRAVEFHRDSLRKKLNLKKSKRNLRAYLASIG
ncbi:MAG: PAS domain S-box protein [Deltaproteobacteria bacterium]|nr:PAS domain S-box protein [Deltaproteobacteria bacterium]